MSDQLAAKLIQVQRDLTSSVAHANEGWNGRLTAERERDTNKRLLFKSERARDEALAEVAHLKCQVKKLETEMTEELATGE